MLEQQTEIRGLFCLRVFTKEESAHKVNSREFSRRSCWDSNSQPFDHESGVLTNKLFRPPTGVHYNAGKIRMLNQMNTEIHIQISFL